MHLGIKGRLIEKTQSQSMTNFAAHFWALPPASKKMRMISKGASGCLPGWKLTAQPPALSWAAAAAWMERRSKSVVVGRVNGCEIRRKYYVVVRCGLFLTVQRPGASDLPDDAGPDRGEILAALGQLVHHVGRHLLLRRGQRGLGGDHVVS